jgi:hypothetical protein
MAVKAKRTWNRTCNPETWLAVKPPFPEVEEIGR